MAERNGVVFMRGKPLTLIGKEIRVGDVAPDFETLNANLETVKLSSFKGKVLVISTVPSLDTQVCDLETKHFNDDAKKLGSEVVFLTVSMDLPFAQKRWASEAKAENISLASDHRDSSLGMAYGVLIKELRLLARTVFVVGKDSKVKYIQYVKETASEPDYNDVLAAVKKALGA